MVTAIQCREWAEGLRIGELLWEHADIIAEEEKRFNDIYEDWYWDGDPKFHLEEQRRKLRRQLEDRIRKDKRAFKNACYAVFGEE